MINAYCNDSITVNTTTYDQWGTASEVSSTVKGRFEFRNKIVRNQQGEQVVSTARVFLPIMTIAHKDKIIYNSVEYSILNISQEKDFSTRYLKLDLA